MCFLANNFDPVFHQVRRRVEAQQVATHAHSEELRTLSPSDHGFHNALRTTDGLRFIDFEYAGWDDPAKMIADALHQPSVPIPPTWRTHFVSRALQHWHSADLVFERIILVEPLVCLNWVLLMLNVFLSDVRRRRESASFGPVTADVMKTKLAAASEKLENVDEISHQLQAEM
jgi:thiamine kinase-like enzyme